VVGDSGNLRVQEFTPTFTGDEVTGASFTRALGWDVVLSGANDANQIETAIVAATGGKFTLGFNGETTADLDYDASSDVVREALEALPSIGAGNIEVAGGPGDAAGLDPYSIIFVGTLGGKANGPISAAAGTPALVGDVSVPAPMNTGGAAQFEVCLVAADCKAGTRGNQAGQLTGTSDAPATATGVEVAIDSRGALYVMSGPDTADCDGAGQLCRVQKFAPSGLFAKEFAPAQLRVTSGTFRGRSLAVDPDRPM
jgi:hypothetical protein